MAEPTTKRPLSGPREVWTYLGVHEMTLYRWAKAGVIPGCKVGGRWRFDMDEIEKWIKNKMNVEVPQ